MLPGGVAPLEPFELDGFEALTVSTGNEPKPARNSGLPDHVCQIGGLYFV